MTAHKASPLGGRLVSWPVMLLAPLAVICGVLILRRLIFGIGAVAALNGGYPWGLWIAFDLLVGTGFACGGWALAWAVYVFNRGEYHPLVRPALLASLFGYSLGGLSITIDVGRYWNLPYFYIPGFFNTNSVLFETAVCMTIYIGVMALEFAPVVFERFGWKKALKHLNKVMFFIISLGALLPTMHQSSMGSLMISAGYKVHPLWQSYELLPLLSLLTAFIMGFSIVTFEGSLVQAGLKGRGPNERSLFTKLSAITQVLLVLFLVLRFGELLWHNKTGYLFVGGLSMLFGAALWRLSYSLLAFNPGGGYHYFPAAQEVLISMGFVAIEVCAYILLIRLLPVLPALGSVHKNYQAEVKHEPTHHH
ncbi:Ni/Fe-hydrogenase cytochrome b subunit [Symbiopectobacterium purcellii]|uniref:Ni/Fe-hydrogenase cytochrome b subunit n=1 Tax=Symbiopectobacterium purcellii TaxID=2871826 RepID=A0ABX9AH31_9ENTR|nr:Ni/Fe-hydrogenase cytochrome b subunit [Symbiopectobacterium purcellii]QZN94418.1 Ni/Fe-hydrogenase cytochrome b subunit [Symbiopectobacterium purcellii]